MERLVSRAKDGAENKSQQSPPSTSLGDSNPRPSSDARSQDQALTTAPKAKADGEGATLFLNHYAARALDRMVLVQTSSLGAAPPPLGCHGSGG
ncbi:hypothetical protein V6N13_066821 [Hibiscus sabdariffa]|uniref:Uncharacterized protein n=1 Tax=Hibiscus sabdariffa TaxID=183260 RepID=A0ABR2DRK1_9ROSI